MHMPTVEGSRWRDRREDLDLSQGDAAPSLKITKRALQNIETVKGRPVGMRVIKRAARFYGCSEEWLQGLDDTPPAAPPAEAPRPKRERDPDPPRPRERPNRDRKSPPRSDLAAAS